MEETSHICDDDIDALPLPETKERPYIKERKLIHAKQITEGKLELLCIRCNKEKPKDEFITKKGYRQKCKICSEKENKSSSTYRLKNLEKLHQNSKMYEELRKKKRDEVIAEHKKMVEDGCDTLKCTKCFDEKPLISFINNRRQKTYHYYECRQSETIIESRRSRDIRVRKPRTREITVSSSLSLKYCVYRNSDIEKGFCKTQDEFASLLPRDYAYYLMKSNCSYCNSLPMSGTVNGLDRVDSKIGHFAFNVVSCCETCNIAKNNLSLKVFIEHIHKIYKNLKYITSIQGSFESII
jgi:hypothetical protein